MSAPSGIRIGCLAPVAFLGWAIIGWALSMPATALYLAIHDPAQLHRSDHWLLLAGMAPIGAILIGWWSSRKVARPIPAIALHAIVLLLISFIGTEWVLERAQVSSKAVELVSMYLGWGSILVYLPLIPLLNVLGGDRRRAVAAAQAPTAAPRPAGKRHHGAKPPPEVRRPRPDTKAPSHPKPRNGQKASGPRGDGKPNYRQGDNPPGSWPSSGARAPGDGKPHYRQSATSRPRGDGKGGTPRQRSAPRSKGDGKPDYRTGSPPQPQGDGKPVYREDPIPQPRGDGKPVYLDESG